MGNRTLKKHIDINGKISAEKYSYSDTSEGNRLLQQTSIKVKKQSLEINKEEKRKLEYNNAGSPITTGKFDYEYNSEQRPIKVYTSTKNKTLIAEYKYNSFGERIKKTVCTNGYPTTTYFLYEDNILTVEADEKGIITAQYIYNNQIPVVKIINKKLYAIHSDHLGTPRIITNDKKIISWKARYSPYGRTEIETQNIELNLRLLGQYEDKETNTHYNYYRSYNPEDGRYSTSDPIGLEGGINSYAYGNGNPIKFVDPLGLKVYLAEKAISGLAGIIGGHTWIIIEPDNINELKSLGFDLSGVLIGNRLALRAGPTKDPNSGQGVGPGKFGWLIATVNGNSTTEWRQHYELKTPEYGQSNACLLISADSLFIRDILEAAQIFDNNYNNKKIRYTYDPFAGDNGETMEFYNSNSYTAGILSAASVSEIPDPWGYQPGIDKPVPIESTFGE